MCQRKEKQTGGLERLIYCPVMEIPQNKQVVCTVSVQGLYHFTLQVEGLHLGMFLHMEVLTYCSLLRTSLSVFYIKSVMVFLRHNRNMQTYLILHLRCQMVQSQ